MVPADEVLVRARVAASEHSGVLTRQEALACGLTAAQIVTLVRRGDWTDLGRGCFAPRPPTGTPGTAALQVAAAVRRRPDAEASRFVAWGAQAAKVLGLPVIVDDHRVGLVDREPPDWRPRTSVVTLPDEDVIKRLGVHVTTPARTVADLARIHGLLAGVAAAHVALRRGTTAVQLAEAAKRVARLRGGPIAVRAAQLARDNAESPLESIGRVQLVLHGFPEPEGQVDVEDANGLIGRVDHVWRRQRVIAEADGRVKYEVDPEDPDKEIASTWDEKKREDRLRSRHVVWRYTWAEAYNRPKLLIAKAEEAFAMASERWPRPPRQS